MAALADRYEIEKEIGSGGMATVYLAQDLKHHRKVAVKVLRPELATSLGTERFLAEIRLTAGLQHPHIVPLFDSGEVDGLLYYVMPYIEGESLRARLASEGRLDVEGMLAVARPVAQALAVAHERGIVHRDIKPENILLSRGQPFVTDFGIARAVSVAGGERLTATGVSVGTPAYMSPEQVLGEESVDERSDVYSLGCVIYEMLSGTPPFSGATIQALLARRLTGPPPHLTNVPSPVDEVVRRSLATAPQDRFATALALADALVEAARKPPVPELSIVVLPFENLSPDPDNAFFADGLTEELIAALSKVRALRVISRTSAMLLKDSKKDVPTIARDLNVRYVLEGSVRRAGNSLRITAQLIDAGSDVHLWADTYRGTLDDVFDLQERLSRHIVEGLEVTLTPVEVERLAKRPIANAAAYDCYLRASREINQYAEQPLERARQFLETGLEMVGPDALLYAGLARVYGAFYWCFIRRDEETFRTAERYAHKAIAMDPDVGPAHTTLAQLAYARGDVRHTHVHSLRALTINPLEADATVNLVHGAGLLGRAAISRPHVERLLQADPLSAETHIAAAMQCYHEGRIEEGVGFARAAYRLDPNNLLAVGWLLWMLALSGRVSEARTVHEAGCRDAPDHPWMLGLGVLLDAFEGSKERVLEGMEKQSEIFAQNWEGDPHGVLFVAGSYAMVRESDEAMKWLERGLEMGIVDYPLLAHGDPSFENLRSEPRYQEFLARVKHEWERSEV